MKNMRTELIKKWFNEDWTETLALDRCRSESSENLIAIGGCARSGTTLTRMILDSHSQLVVGPPTNVFVPIPLNSSDIAFRLALDEKRVAQLVARARDRIELINVLASETKAVYKKQRWGEKTARNVLRFRWILRHFPNSRVVHVMRDGRDVVCSLRTHRRRQVIDGNLVPIKNEMPLEHCIERWAQSVQTGIASRGDNRYYELRYEDLIADPISTTRDLCNFLDLPFEQTMLRFHEFEGPLRAPVRFPQNLEATFPIYSSAVGRWHRDLGEQEQREVETRVAPLLSQLGYL
jgi:hypothetical protein